MALHWVIHSKPDMLDVERIFDDVRVLPNGGHRGGEGKLNMYVGGSVVVLKDLEFIESPPLTDLIRRLFRLFQSLACFNNPIGEPDAGVKESVEKLKNCKTIRTFFRETATRGDWPRDCDKAATNIYSTQEGIDLLDLVGRGYVRRKANPSLRSERTEGSGSSKRGREEDKEVTGPKRPKVSKTR
jgi:hypothetical protein